MLKIIKFPKSFHTFRTKIVIFYLFYLLFYFIFTRNGFIHKEIASNINNLNLVYIIVPLFIIFE